MTLPSPIPRIGLRLLPALCLVFVVACRALQGAESADAEVLLPKTFTEAPQLRERVKAGNLPPVSKRLPKLPLVVVPCEKIGRYGGIWHRAHLGPSDACGATYIMK